MSSEIGKQSQPDDLDYWRLCDELSIRDAAMLVIGKSPSARPQAEQQPIDARPSGYEAVETAISNALLGERIAGTVNMVVVGYEEEIPIYQPDVLDVGTSRVEVESLKKWLVSRGFSKGFFFPEPAEPTDYLDKSNPRYAPKLAAAVKAWQAVDSTPHISPKKAVSKWLREHAAEFDLVDDDGKVNETGIEEIAKVTNWQPSGGAPKTPGGV